MGEEDHLNWELLGEVARGLKGEDAKAVKDALKEVEEQEDEHLTAIGAARAKKARREML